MISILGLTGYVIALTAPASAKDTGVIHTPDDPAAMQALWTAFQSEYQRKYVNSKEKEMRYDIFMKNLKRMDGMCNLYI